MKAITLTQPWATLVALGQKHIETRSWRTDYRGPLAIHAAKGLGRWGGERGLRHLCCSAAFFEALHAGGIDLNEVDVDVLPLGAIVAVCELHDCRSTAEEAVPGKRGWFGHVGDTPTYWDLTDQERAFGDYSPGRYAWLLANIRALPEPIPVRGALGLWNYDGEL